MSSQTWPGPKESWTELDYLIIRTLAQGAANSLRKRRETEQSLSSVQDKRESESEDA